MSALVALRTSTEVDAVLVHSPIIKSFPDLIKVSKAIKEMRVHLTEGISILILSLAMAAISFLLFSVQVLESTGIPMWKGLLERFLKAMLIPAGFLASFYIDVLCI